MTSTYRLAPDLGRPVERHKLTESAEAARRAVRNRRAIKRDAELVTSGFERPHSETVPMNAANLRAKAKAAGFEVRVGFGYWTSNAGKSNETKTESCRVEGWHAGRREGFSAVWAPGAKLGLWRTQAHPGGEAVGVSGVMARV